MKNKIDQLKRFVEMITNGRGDLNQQSIEEQISEIASKEMTLEERKAFEIIIEKYSQWKKIKKLDQINKLRNK